MDHRKTYAGVFLVALATLVLEILLTRITSVVAWYHLAFFVISLAMLGMTAGAVQVAAHRLRKRYRRTLESVIAETLDDPSEAENELNHILQILAGR